MKAERFLERKSQKDFRENIWTGGKGLFVCFLGGEQGRKMGRGTDVGF